MGTAAVGEHMLGQSRGSLLVFCFGLIAALPQCRSAGHVLESVHRMAGRPMCYQMSLVRNAVTTSNSIPDRPNSNRCVSCLGTQISQAAFPPSPPHPPFVLELFLVGLFQCFDFLPLTATIYINNNGGKLIVNLFYSYFIRFWKKIAHELCITSNQVLMAC